MAEKFKLILDSIKSLIPYSGGDHIVILIYHKGEQNYAKPASVLGKLSMHSSYNSLLTMDSDDASEIYDHLEHLDINSKQMTTQINKQVKINNELISSIEKIKNRTVETSLYFKH